MSKEPESKRLDLPRVKIIGFGGTIAMAPDREGVLHPAKSVNELISQVPSLDSLARVTLEQVQNKDSTNITPKDWRQLISKIHDAEQSTLIDGIVVTHGTDTMAYTASAVALAFGRELSIPVVFTGAQLPMGTPGTDARFNLENAMKTVIAAKNEGITEAMIVFSNKVLRGARTIKISEAEFDAFDSPAIPPLASITATGIEFQDFAFRHDGVKTEQNPKLKFNRHIFTVEVVPGLNPKLLMKIIESGKCGGLLLKSLGSGNVPSEGTYSLLPVIKRAGELNIPTLIATKFVGGNTHMEMYDPGKKALDMGAIPAGDMTDVMAQVKLMWLLGNRNISEPVDLTWIKEKIQTDFVGEVTEG